MTASDGALKVLLTKKWAHPHRGRWSLPGGFVGVDKDLEDAAKRVLREKAGLETAVRTRRQWHSGFFLTDEELLGD
jgi:8-oxo-dGTP diphosphatase